MLTSTVNHTLEAKALADLMVTAIEGGCTHWAESLELLEGTDLFEPPYYADPKFYSFPFKLALTDCEGDVHTLTIDELTKGWSLLLQLYPRRALSAQDESYDAEDADVFLQLAVYGDVIYG